MTLSDPLISATRTVPLIAHGSASPHCSSTSHEMVRPDPHGVGAILPGLLQDSGGFGQETDVLA